MLPGLLLKLKKIKDPRQPLKIKHKITVLMIYGILLFVYQVGSRRTANKELSAPIFFERLLSGFGLVHAYVTRSPISESSRPFPDKLEKKN